MGYLKVCYALVRCFNFDYILLDSWTWIYIFIKVHFALAETYYCHWKLIWCRLPWMYLFPGDVFVSKKYEKLVISWTRWDVNYLTKNMPWMGQGVYYIIQGSSNFKCKVNIESTSVTVDQTSGYLNENISFCMFSPIFYALNYDLIMEHHDFRNALIMSISKFWEFNWVIFFMYI